MRLVVADTSPIFYLLSTDHIDPDAVYKELCRRGLVDLADSFARLKRTNFRYRQEIMDALLDEQADD